MKAPCLNCELRQINCHSKCNKYKEFKESRNKIKKDNIDYGNYLYDAIARMKG